MHCFNLTSNALKNLASWTLFMQASSTLFMFASSTLFMLVSPTLFVLSNSTFFMVASSTLFMLASSNVVHAGQLNVVHVGQLNVVHAGQLMVAMSSTFFKPCNKPRPWSCCSFLHNQNNKINYFDLDICNPSPKMQNSIHKCIALSTFAYPSILTSYYALIFLQLAHI